MHIPITDANGVEVPDSWSEAKDRGALTFWAEEMCGDCGKCRRFYVEGLRCYGCTTPSAPTWTDVADSYEIAISRGFRLYHDPETCQAVMPLRGERSHGNVRTTATLRCTACEREDVQQAHEARSAQLAAEDAANKAAYLALRREEHKLDREARAEQRKLEATTEAITRTIGRAGKGRTRTTERAVKMLEALPSADDTPTPTRKREPRRAKAATARRNPNPRRKPRARK